MTQRLTAHFDEGLSTFIDFPDAASVMYEDGAVLVVGEDGSTIAGAVGPRSWKVEAS